LDRSSVLRLDFERKTYKLGSPFPITGKGFCSILLVFGLIALIYNGLPGMAIFGPTLMLFLVVVCSTIKVYLEPDQAIYKKVFNLFGIEIGRWRQIGEAKGLIIKNVQLSDKDSFGSTGFSAPFLSRSLFSYYAKEYSRENVWFVEAAYSGSKKVTIMISDKEDAFDFVNAMVDRCSFEVYLAHYKGDRKLNRNKLKENELVFQKKPDVFKTRRR
jgi:hypothetical protein